MWQQNESEWETVRPNLATYGKGHWIFHLQQHISGDGRSRIVAEHHKRRGEPGDLHPDSFAYEVMPSGRHFCSVLGKQQPGARLPNEVIEVAKDLAGKVTGIGMQPQHAATPVRPQQGGFVAKEMARRQQRQKAAASGMGGPFMNEL